MQVTELVARELGLFEYDQTRPVASVNGVTTVEIESRGVWYRIHLVRDANNEDVTMEEGARLGAFYNSKFFLELLESEKVDLPCERLIRSFQIEDEHANHSIFITNFYRFSTASQPIESRYELALPELIKVAEKIAKIHAINISNLPIGFVRAVKENHENILEQQQKLLHPLVGLLKEAVNGDEMREYFQKPHQIVHFIDEVSRHYEPIQTENQILSHGKLTGDNCKFEDDALVEITDWEQVHFADPALDLSYLIISSSDPSIRRNHFMKVFRQYYYTLVDLRTPKFKLADLKTLYRKHHTGAVLAGIEYLLEILSSNSSEEVKKRAANRWETALEDAIDFISGDYISDDEQCFFAK